MNYDLLKIDSIYGIGNYTQSDIIYKKINEYIDELYKSNFNNNLDIFYIGTLNNNDYNINGNGILFKNNILIKGDIKNNIYTNCELNFIYNNSTNIIFEGSIINNNIYKGTLKYNNIKLSGEFLNGLPHKKCTLNTNNITYNGSWYNGKKTGYGSFETTSYKYNGEWNNDIFNGIGTLFTNNNNTIYNGSFLNGKKHGKGTLNTNKETFYVEYNLNILEKKLTMHQKENSDLKSLNNKLNNKLDGLTSIIQSQEDKILLYNSKISALNKELNKNRETILCKICYKNNSCILLSPCSHISTCSTCIRQITSKKCPICRCAFRTYTNVYIS